MQCYSHREGEEDKGVCGDGCGGQQGGIILFRAFTEQPQEQQLLSPAHFWEARRGAAATVGRRCTTPTMSALTAAGVAWVAAVAGGGRGREAKEGVLVVVSFHNYLVPLFALSWITYSDEDRI